ncbi:carboxymuconolactone decarboxylase family protein [Rhodococcus sp. PAMC28707]|uniref:carboxymuconolactone decarboxylase family protein n=1 Tax=unclassified Rhodococcus (in: high G+C Gram-positive bacteria) TaxID=192944 RepID=UPI00109DD341|nr:MULTISPECIES: carboxymuconolactone decarboxylase family protein [unclassified Rhodococcus (in: high G+C Gram-positive bacteria)]QCB49727.1 carboxymuconolactone decarboxylase family protein [Rhodococcus sp. PAMC28705]QCB58581.1 carboxymuconolactone decarboxylase family protein [Rhodococcus sp. PAMC28707]
MTTRIDFASSDPAVRKALVALDAATRAGIDPALAELIRIRASQLNGCAYCLHMHTSDARKAGESEEKLALVAVWRDARNFFDEKEQAVLALTESVTLISQGGVPDDVYDRVAEYFDDHGIAQLIAQIFTINAWNRIGITTHLVPGVDNRTA